MRDPGSLLSQSTHTSIEWFTGCRRLVLDSRAVWLWTCGSQDGRHLHRRDNEKCHPERRGNGRGYRPGWGNRHEHVFSSARCMNGGGEGELTILRLDLVCWMWLEGNLRKTGGRLRLVEKSHQWSKNKWWTKNIFNSITSLAPACQ